MNTRITVAVVIAFIAYAVYSWLSTPSYDGFDINRQQYKAYTQAPPEPSPYAPRIVSPAGPGAPAQRAPVDEPAVIMPSEEPYDPQQEPYESAEIPERLRHPERAFGPGLDADDTATASANVTTEAYQVFGPNFAQNDGAFMESGVVANDSSMETNYSSV
jgi:hypothetical protein